MGCALPCKHTGSCCDNGEIGIICAWTNALTTALAEKPAVSAEQAVKRCSKIHYDALDMDAVLEPYVGQPEAFYRMIQEKWGWIITVEDGGGRILADENKSDCVCPLVRAGAADSPLLCNCSEGFAELMFSRVLQRPIRARVLESVLRGGTHCVYEIRP